MRPVARSGYGARCGECMMVKALLGAALGAAFSISPALAQSYHDGVYFSATLTCSSANFMSEDGRGKYWTMRIEGLISTNPYGATPVSVSSIQQTSAIGVGCSFCYPIAATARHYLNNPTNSYGSPAGYMTPCNGVGGACGVTSAQQKKCSPY
jgi:hypothetical protein